MTILRKATPDDAQRIETFLLHHAVTSMYLRGNLAAHGVGFSDHAHSTEFYLWGNGKTDGVFGVTKSGYLMAQVPGMPDAAVAAFAKQVDGMETLGMTGVVDQVDPVLHALGLKDADYQLDHDEPLYRMDLDNLPADIEPCRPMIASDLPVMVPWFADYMYQTGLFDQETARQNAPERAQEDLESGQLRVIEEGGKPVAMAKLNAVIGEHAQVGGVFVPTSARRRGLGGRVTVALLQDGRAQGIRVANLFANSPNAARVYERIGFEQVGWYRIALLARPQIIRGAMS